MEEWAESQIKQPLKQILDFQALVETKTMTGLIESTSLILEQIKQLNSKKFC